MWIVWNQAVKINLRRVDKKEAEQEQVAKSIGKEYLLIHVVMAFSNGVQVVAHPVVIALTIFGR